MGFWGSICLILVILLGSGADTLAGPLAERLGQFPEWKNKPPVQAAKGDLVYPDWMAGTWAVTSTLVDRVAPLAPKIVTPGFEENRRYLNQPVRFQVRFGEKSSGTQARLPVPSLIGDKLPVVADRAFNGLKIAEAYLGNRAVLSVKVDPDNPNRQITFLGGDRQLISMVTGRGREIPAPDRFVATEVTEQVFRGESQIYLNEVETTTAYQLLDSGEIEANQVTAIYLSPQDPDYFTAAGRPVALYRYRLELLPVDD